MKIRIPQPIKEIARIFNQAEHQCYLVGGAVRNQLTGLPVYDYDLSTDAPPDEVMRLFRRVIPTGIKHGTVTILYKGESYETTTFRVDGKYSNQRHPDEIVFTPSLEEDLKRRDFTINSIAASIPDGKILDPNKGLDDIDRKCIRAIGVARDRFNEDGLRSLRACRFAAQLEFSVVPETEKAMADTLSSFQKVSAERILDELKKTMKAPRPSEAFILMERTGMLEMILPELTACRGITQKGSHLYDVFTHSLAACDGAPRGNFIVRMAALLHDIGKAPTRRVDEQGEVTFHQHEAVSARMTEKIMKRLKSSNEVREAIVHLVRQHMFHYQAEWSDAAVRRFIRRSGVEHLENLYHLRRADHYGTNGTTGRDPLLEELQDRVNEEIARENVLTLKDLAVNGNSLSEKAEIPKGKMMGTILHELLETVTEDPGLNTEEQLLVIARRFYKELVQ